MFIKFTKVHKLGGGGRGMAGKFFSHLRLRGVDSYAKCTVFPIPVVHRRCYIDIFHWLCEYALVLLARWGHFLPNATVSVDDANFN